MFFEPSQTQEVSGLSQFCSKKMYFVHLIPTLHLCKCLSQFCSEESILRMKFVPGILQANTSLISNTLLVNM